MEDLSPGLLSLDSVDFDFVFADLLNPSSNYNEGGDYNNTQLSISLPEPSISDFSPACDPWYETNGECHTHWKSQLSYDLTPGKVEGASRGKGMELGSSTFSYMGPGVGGEVDCMARPNHGGGSAEVGQEPQGAKAGSQAFDYIADFAVQEINGISVNHTDFFKKSLMTLDEESCLHIPFQLEGSEEKEHPIKCLSRESVLGSCKTQTHPAVSLVELQDTSKKGVMVGCVQTPKKKRRRKRKPPQEGGTKKKKYELEPLSDAREEQRRKDAVRAKLCREKNRKEVLKLKDSLDKLQKEKDDLACELAGIRQHEAKLLNLLKAKYNIIVEPYHHPLQ